MSEARLAEFEAFQATANYVGYRTDTEETPQGNLEPVYVAADPVQVLSGAKILAGYLCDGLSNERAGLIQVGAWEVDHYYPATFQTRVATNYFGGTLVGCEVLTSPAHVASRTSLLLEAIARESYSSQQMARLYRRRKHVLEDKAAEATANRAMADAATFLDAHFFRVFPHAMLSEEGIVMLQWRSGDRGTLLMFSGDGFVTYSSHGPDRDYISNSEEFPILNGLSPEAIKAISELS